MNKVILQNYFFKKVGLPQYTKLFQFTIVVGVLLLSLFVALRPSSRFTILLVVALVIVAISIIFLRNMALGLLGIIVACFLMPNFLGGGGLGATLSPPVLLIIFVIGLWLVDMVIRRRKIELVRSGITLPVIIFTIATLIAFLNGQINYYVNSKGAPLVAQIGGLLIILLSLAAFMASGNLIYNLKWLKYLTWLYLVIAALYIFARLFSQVGNFILPIYQYGSDVAIFWIFLVSLAFSQALYNRHLAPFWRISLGLLVLLTFYVSFGLSRFWTSGWFPPFVAIVVIVWAGVPRLRLPIVVVGFLLLILGFQNITDLFWGGDNNEFTFLARREAWRIVIEIAKANPIIGVGFANYYWYATLFPILGYYLPFNSHQNYIDLFAQTGIFGFLSFLWLMISVWVLGWRLLSYVPEGFPKAYVYGALGGLVGMLVSGMFGDWFLPYVYNVGFNGFRSSVLGWLFLGGLVSLEAIYKPKSIDIPKASGVITNRRY